MTKIERGNEASYRKRSVQCCLDNCYVVTVMCEGQNSAAKSVLIRFRDKIETVIVVVVVGNIEFLIFNKYSTERKRGR